MTIYKNMTSELETKFRDELKNNSEKDSSLEFIQTTNLENDIINEYGFSGIKLILLETKNVTNLYNLGKFPKDCPWSNLNDKTISEFITKNFSPISKKIPDIIDSLKERCKFIFVEKKEYNWYLHYLLSMKLYDGRDYFRIYTGGSPLLNPKPNDNLAQFDWCIPNDLKELYSIHNGFGEFYDANFIMANEDIKVMAEMMDPICEEQDIKPEGYSFDDLLEFLPDGSGNAQCFYKKDGEMTVDWDHDIWKISEEIGFFEFINERLAEIDEE